MSRVETAKAVAHLRERLETALAKLPEMRAAFVRAHLDNPDPVGAAIAAGYSEKSAPDLVRRMQRDPRVREALALAADLRASLQSFGKGDLVRLLSAALQVRREDFLVYGSDGVTPIGLVPLETLSLAHQLRIKRYAVRTRAGTSGKRPRIHSIELELTDVHELVDKIAALSGWIVRRSELDATVTALRSPLSELPVSATTSDAERRALDEMLNPSLPEGDTQ